MSPTCEGGWLACVLVLCLGTSGRAQVGPSQREQARALLREGNEKLDRGLYLDALSAFHKAFEVFPSPKLHFNIAQTYNELGRVLDALDHYERFVREVNRGDVPGEWATAQDQIFKLKGAIATVDVQVSATQAQVIVDGSPVGSTPLDRPIRLMPGSHAVVVSKPGYERQLVETTLRPGDAITRRIELITEDQAVATRAAVRRAEAERKVAQVRLLQVESEQRDKQRRASRILRTAGFVTLAVGLAASLAGAVLGGFSRAESATVENAAAGASWNDLVDSFDRAANYRVGAQVTAPIGAAFAVAGAVLIGIGHRKSSARPAVSALPALGGLVVQARF